jgi:hypothetical protein
MQHTVHRSQVLKTLKLIGLAILGSLSLTACFFTGPSKPEVYFIKPSAPVTASIRRIAMEPNRDVFADPLASPMSKYGYNVVTPANVWGLLERLNIRDGKLYDQESLRAINKQGIDAILIVRSVIAPDGIPSAISLRAVLTANGQPAGGWYWDNPRRIGVADSAEFIAERVAADLRSY